MNEKEAFVEPVVEIVVFEGDVICTSCPTQSVYCTEQSPDCPSETTPIPG